MNKPEYRISTGTIKDISVIALIVIIAWKAISADFSFTFENIKTSDLLSLLLALFAIGLSVAFFVKANEVSNMFYDNMYKFTKDNSELLGRMESGFSEQLRHLDQGYTGLRDKFDKLPLDLSKTRERVEDEKAEVLKLKTEKDALLNELATKANLQEEEKKELFEKLSASESKLNKAQRELRHFQHKLRDANDPDETINGVAARAVYYTRRKVLGLLNIDNFKLASDDEISNCWLLIKDELSKSYLIDLRRAELINSEEMLTSKGAQFLRDVAEDKI